MFEECLNSKKLRFKIKLNNLIGKIDHNIQNAFHLDGTISNQLFMHSLPSTGLAQSIVIDKIDGHGLLLIRFGLYEYQLCYQYLEKVVGLRKEYTDNIMWHIHNDAGILWQNEKDLDDYAKFIIDNMRLVDVIAYWRNYPSKFVFKDLMKKNSKHINVEDLYPYPFWHKDQLPFWQNVLKGKRVLLITSFSDTVSKQYMRREKIWENVESILPRFELITFQSVCTNGGQEDRRFGTWIDAVSYMKNEIMEIECDIVLVSCGGYGIPLSIELRKLGKCVIQWGGCYQLWFGIKGARWDNVNEIKEYFNDYWVYPSKSETPPNFHQVNDSCYWKGE